MQLGEASGHCSAANGSGPDRYSEDESLTQPDALVWPDSRCAGLWGSGFGGNRRLTDAHLDDGGRPEATGVASQGLPLVAEAAPSLGPDGRRGACNPGEEA